MHNNVIKKYNYDAHKLLLYRDLAAENCWIGDQYLVKVAITGLSRRITGQVYIHKQGEKVHTRWVGPEVWFMQKSTSKSDVWCKSFMIMNAIYIYIYLL